MPSAHKVLVTGAIALGVIFLVATIGKRDTVTPVGSVARTLLSGV